MVTSLREYENRAVEFGLSPRSVINLIHHAIGQLVLNRPTFNYNLMELSVESAYQSTWEAYNIKKDYDGVVKFFDVENKVFRIIADQAANNKKAFELEKENDKNDFLQTEPGTKRNIYARIVLRIRRRLPYGTGT